MRLLPVFLVLFVLSGLLPPAVAAGAPEAAPPDTLAAQAAPRRDFFGMVGRDPWYTLDVDGQEVADQPPLEFLDRMAAELAALGVSWVRIEFHAEIGQTVGPGFIDYAKYDRFIREIAPRHGLKVLALLNSGILADTDWTYRIERVEDPPDGAGIDPADRSNNYIRLFVGRSQEIATHYGDDIAAYEVFNEPNVNAQKYLVTGGVAQEINAERYATLMTNTYLALKRVRPFTPVVMGGMLHGSPVEKPDRIVSDYLADVFAAPRVEWYRTTRPIGPGSIFPWDAVALHPYDLPPHLVEVHIREVKARMAALGDLSTRIWITELGLQAEPPPVIGNWLMAASLQENNQAEYLTQTYTRLLAMPDIVDRVFWFKYEDFREEGRPRNWGLVRLRENGRGQYEPEAEPYPRKPAYAAFQRLANPGAVPTARRPEPATTEAGSRYFPETGQVVSGPFLRYWEARGGLARFGLPRTAAFFQGGYLVQYFERARFEYHEELKGTPHEVQLGLLGELVIDDVAALQASEPLPKAPETRYFPETRHNLSHGFKAYWEKNDGLRYFGLPITEEFAERNPADGKIYAVQYFERARFEYHPEHKGTPHEVQLGLLGNQILATENWYR